MKVAAQYQIEKAASSDAMRPVLANAWLETGKSRLLASNSYMLAVVPVEVEEGDVDGPVSGEALVSARKLAKHETPNIACNGSLEVQGGPTFPRPASEGMKFPDADQVWPAAYDGEAGVDFYEVGFNPTLLLELCKAIGLVGGKRFGAPCRLRIMRNTGTGAVDPLRPFEVIGADGAKGILMPVKLS